MINIMDSKITEMIEKRQQANRDIISHLSIILLTGNLNVSPNNSSIFSCEYFFCLFVIIYTYKISKSLYRPLSTNSDNVCFILSNLGVAVTCTVIRLP